MNTKHGSSDLLRLGMWTVLTAALYGGFFFFIDQIFGFFTSGTILGAIGVVVTALLFSFIHGSFASQLLDTVGLKARKEQGE